jgi:hypothetical protein
MKLKRNDTIPTASGIDDPTSVGIRKNHYSVFSARYEISRIQ